MRAANCFLFLVLLTLALVGCSGPGIIDDEVIEPSKPDSDTAIADTIPQDIDTIAPAPDTIAWRSVAEAQRIYNADDIKYIYLCGYIVGTVKSSMNTGCNFAAPFTVETNILIADTPAPASVDDCLPVELKKGSDARAALNLVDNPQLAGRRVVIFGTLQRYFRVAGLKSVLEFEIL